MQWKRGTKDFVNKFRWRYTTCLWVFFLPYVFYESKLRLIIRIVSLVRHPARRNQSGNASLGKVPLSFLLHCPKTGQSICKSLIKEACWCCMYKLCFCFNSSPPPVWCLCKVDIKALVSQCEQKTKSNQSYWRLGVKRYSLHSGFIIYVRPEINVFH